ncbi:1-acyl-sn-glycerol-3-phosphate acyltransferase alpha-like [Saccostrea echinata]|uniref:1-acyl-sn-glycerol-3-phosphate acyltransferase alpha-like n=1 Tax=Saccostrea echinata TaxID=191078 RepID=UPI002A83290D|nr:1-acyl-sn-glycerol-3-phosphate acyltransferase alpha-like [Saccostrea echinata]
MLQVFLWCSVISIILYLTSNTFRYYAKYGVYLLVLTIISTITVLWILFTCRPKSSENFRFAIWSLHKLKYLYGWEFETHGKEYLMNDKPLVVLVNHQSGLDLLGLMELWDWRYHCTAVGKRSLMYMGVFGLACYLCDGVFLDRHDHAKAVQQMNAVVDQIHSKKLKVFVFPEGTRNRNGSMLAFKKGAFHIAVQSQVPIVPVVFSSYKSIYSKEKKIFKSGKITITCLPPVSTAGRTKDDIPELMNSIRNSMVETYNRTSSSVGKTE